MAKRRVPERAASRLVEWATSRRVPRTPLAHLMAQKLNPAGWGTAAGFEGCAKRDGMGWGPSPSPRHNMAFYGHNQGLSCAALHQFFSNYPSATVASTDGFVLLRWCHTRCSSIPPIIASTNTNTEAGPSPSSRSRARTQSNQPPADAEQDRSNDQRAVDGARRWPPALRPRRPAARGGAHRQSPARRLRGRRPSPRRGSDPTPRNRSRNASTLLGCIMPDTSRPAPKTSPQPRPIRTSRMA